MSPLAAERHDVGRTDVHAHRGREALAGNDLPVQWTRARLAALAVPGSLCLVVLFTPLMDGVLGDDDLNLVPVPVWFGRWPPAFALAILAVLAGRMAQRAPTTMRHLATAVTIISYASMVLAVVLPVAVFLLFR